VLTNNPTVTYLYLETSDYWLRTHYYQMYVRPEGRRLHDIHSGAILIRDVDELKRVLYNEARGRRAWVVAWNSPLHWGRAVDPEVRKLVEQRSRRPIQAQDWLIYELRL
jgi:hypothetical protein